MIENTTVISIDLSDQERRRKVIQIVCGIQGVDKAEVNEAKTTLTVTGTADPIEVICCARKIVKGAEIESIGPTPPPPNQDGGENGGGQKKAVDDGKNAGGNGGGQEKADDDGKKQEIFDTNPQPQPFNTYPQPQPWESFNTYPQPQVCPRCSNHDQVPWCAIM